MSQNTCTLDQSCTNKPHLHFVLALIALVFASCCIAQAATVPFTYTITGQSATTGQPPTLNEAFTGTAIVVPFGNATYTDSGTLTLGQFPNDGFGAMSLLVDYTLSFNNGADTFFGKESVSFSPPDKNGVQTSGGPMTIIGGTGIFSGATGSGTGSSTVSPPPPTGPNTVTIFGSGEITAPGLAAIPEPTTGAFLAIAITGLVGLTTIRKRRSSTAN